MWLARSILLLAVVALHTLFAHARDGLICDLALNDVFFENHDLSPPVDTMEEFFSCHPVDETGHSMPLNYVLELPDALQKECRRRLVRHQNCFVSIPGGKVERSYVKVPEPSLIQIISHGAAERRKRELKMNRDVRATGMLKVLMLRVTTNDAEPSLTAEELYRLTFLDEVSLVSQMARCSFGKLQVEPTEYGVMDIKIDMDIAGKEYGEAVNAGYVEAVKHVKENVKDVRELVDAVMFVIPPGSNGDWAAFGALNGKQTTFNDKWAGYIGASMHEIGHNLGLLHENENGVEYQGKTGYMGSAPQTKHYPQKCYNAQNHYHLGWYNDRVLELDADGSDLIISPRLVRIAAFVDYDMTDETTFVVVKVGNYYFQFNRAKKFNIDTSEQADNLVVVKFVPGVGTNLLGGLHRHSPVFAQRLNSSILTVKLCSVSEGDNVSTADVMEVSFGLDGASACIPAPIVLPTPAPTAAPTAKATSSPTKIPTSRPVADPITLVVTLPPTPPPTIKPTATPTQPPTVSPTAIPTAPPTIGHTASPTLKATTSPTVSLTASPTTSPTLSRTASPVADPTFPTRQPGKAPTRQPYSTKEPTDPSFESPDTQTKPPVDEDSNDFSGKKESKDDQGVSVLALVVLILLLLGCCSAVVLYFIFGAARKNNDRDQLPRSKPKQENPPNCLVPCRKWNRDKTVFWSDVSSDSDDNDDDDDSNDAEMENGLQQVVSGFFKPWFGLQDEPQQTVFYSGEMESGACRHHNIDARSHRGLNSNFVNDHKRSKRECGHYDPEGHRLLSEQLAAARKNRGLEDNILHSSSSSDTDDEVPSFDRILFDQVQYSESFS